MKFLASVSVLPISSKSENDNSSMKKLNNLRSLPSLNIADRVQSPCLMSRITSVIEGAGLECIWLSSAQLVPS